VVRAEVLERADLLACTPGTSNLILIPYRLDGNLRHVSIDPGVDQTAYGVLQRPGGHRPGLQLINSAIISIASE
jgi:hypothetical protein